MFFKEVDEKENTKQLIQLLGEQQEELFSVPNEEPKIFSLALYDTHNRYIGGITASKWMNTCHISLLAIKKQYRGQGYGSQLLQKAEAFAYKEQVTTLTINTQDYQAKSFYESFGFEVFGQLADFPFEGTTKYYLVKRLNEGVLPLC